MKKEIEQFQRLFKRPENKKILYKNRFVSGINQDEYKHAVAPYYSIFHFLKLHSDVYRYFIEWRTFAEFELFKVDRELKAYVLLYKSSGHLCTWTIAHISSDEFDLIFPHGIPQTERSFDKWLSHVGYLAKQHHLALIKNECEVYARMRPTIERFAHDAKTLKMFGFDVDEVLKKALK